MAPDECNCDGAHKDCEGTCGGDVGVDECGRCGGPGIVAPKCDCAGNVKDCK